MKDLIRGGVNINFGQPIEETDLSLELISRAAQEGVPLARNLMSKAGDMIGNLLVMVCNIVDPEKVILSGILSQEEIYPTLIGQLKESFQKGHYCSRREVIKIEPSQAGHGCLPDQRGGLGLRTDDPILSHAASVG